MAKDKIKLMIDLVSADVICAIMEETSVSAQEAMKEFFNSEIYNRLCDPQTGLYRESGGYVYEFYKNFRCSCDCI